MIIGISIPSFIVLLGGLITYGYISDVKIRQNFVQIADDLREQVLEVRRNEKNFLLFKDNNRRLSLHNAISVVSASIKEISPETSAEYLFSAGLFNSTPASLTVFRKTSTMNQRSQSRSRMKAKNLVSLPQKKGLQRNSRRVLFFI